MVRISEPSTIAFHGMNTRTRRSFVAAPWALGDVNVVRPRPTRRAVSGNARHPRRGAQSAPPRGQPRSRATAPCQDRAAATSARCSSSSGAVVRRVVARTTGALRGRRPCGDRPEVSATVGPAGDWYERVMRAPPRGPPLRAAARIVRSAQPGKSAAEGSRVSRCAVGQGRRKWPSRGSIEGSTGRRRWGTSGSQCRALGGQPVRDFAPPVGGPAGGAPAPRRRPGPVHCLAVAAPRPRAPRPRPGSRSRPAAAAALRARRHQGSRPAPARRAGGSPPARRITPASPDNVNIRRPPPVPSRWRSAAAGWVRPNVSRTSSEAIVVRGEPTATSSGTSEPVATGRQRNSSEQQAGDVLRLGLDAPEVDVRRPPAPTTGWPASPGT